ncbi:MAG TPA: EamA family transporter [Candidatus Krumholzibacteria bacterium]|nr:EamA family transporter [Candidatus Krumholzibacteria bacterium]
MGQTFVLGALFVLATACANVLQKKAMQGLGEVTVPSVEALRRLLVSPHLWGGLGCWALALVSYMIILSRVPLNVATSIASLSFVAVLLASRLVLGEPIPPLRILGFACILVGMSIVAYTQRGSA